MLHCPRLPTSSSENVFNFLALVCGQMLGRHSCIAMMGSHSTVKRHVSGQIQTYLGGITFPSWQSTTALALFLALAEFQEHQVSVCTGKIVLAPGECQRLPASTRLAGHCQYPGTVTLCHWPSLILVGIMVLVSPLPKS